MSQQSLRKGSFDRPSTLYPAGNTRPRKTNYLSPFSQWMGYAIFRYETIVSGVSILLARCSPATIRRAIVAIIVDSIDGKIMWSISHVFQKIKKVVPSVAYFYSAIKISALSVRVAFSASLNHSLPDFVCSGVASSVSFSMLGHKTILS